HHLPEALEIFDQRFLARMPVYLSALTLTSHAIDDVRQALRDKLMIASPGPPKIVQYTGRGALDSWVRVVAVRTALNLLAAEKPHQSLDETTLAPAGGDVERGFIQSRYRRHFTLALRAAAA